MLTGAQQAAREYRVTASFLPSLMRGDDAEILREWMRLVGHPDYQPEDLSDRWPPSFGSFVEPFALDWHQRMTGQPLIRRGETVVHPARPFFSCTLDAWRDSDRTVIDAKACGHWQTLEEIEAYYTPQIIGQIGCTEADAGALLVVHGGAEPVELPIFIEQAYVDRVWLRVDQFQHCVETMTPPVPLPTVVPPERWRTINLDNEEIRRATNWSEEIIENLLVWQLYQDYNKQFESAKVRVKELLPADVGLVTVAGMAIKRARNNAVTIKLAKQANA